MSFALVLLPIVARIESSSLLSLSSSSSSAIPSMTGIPLLVFPGGSLGFQNAETGEGVADDGFESVGNEEEPSVSLLPSSQLGDAPAPDESLPVPCDGRPGWPSARLFNTPPHELRPVGVGPSVGVPPPPGPVFDCCCCYRYSFTAP